MTTKAEIAARSGVENIVLNPAPRSLARRVWSHIEDFLVYRILKSAEAELHALDDRMLKDMGLHRNEIGSVLSELADDCRTRSRICKLSGP